jgi:hypothetical protein
MVAKVRDYYAAEVEHLLGYGIQPADIAQRLGINGASLARALHRERRNDLARPFWREFPTDAARINRANRKAAA